MIRMLTVAALALAPAAATAEAVLKIDYQPRANYESFLVTNVATCAPVTISEIQMNLETAAVPAAFDTAPGEGDHVSPAGSPLAFPRGQGFVSNIDLPEEEGTTILFELTDFTQGSSFEVGLGVETPTTGEAGRDFASTVRDLEGLTVSALITNPAGETRAEVGVMTAGVATVVWDLACEGAGDGTGLGED